MRMLGATSHCVEAERRGCRKDARGNGRAGRAKETERFLPFFLSFEGEDRLDFFDGVAVLRDAGEGAA